jgi:hypothetical protein
MRSTRAREGGFQLFAGLLSALLAVGRDPVDCTASPYPAGGNGRRAARLSL